jgi:hypothetical protein
VADKEEVEQQPEVESLSPEPRRPGRPRKDERVYDPEEMMTHAVQENLRVLTSIRIKVEKLVKKVSDTIDKNAQEGNNSIEQQQVAMKALSDLYKTLSDSTANAVKGLAALKKIKPNADESKDDEILAELFKEEKSE